MGNTVSYCIRIYIPISYAFVRIIQKIAPPITVNKSHAWMHEERDSVTSFQGGAVVRNATVRKNSSYAHKGPRVHIRREV